jgi:hypothetical protein
MTHENQKTLRGGRIIKRGKQVLSLHAAIGIVVQAIGLAVLSAVVYPVAASAADECGTMVTGGGAITCDTNSYMGSGDGTVGEPASSPINYSGVYSADPSIAVGIVSETSSTAVRLTSLINSGAVSSAISLFDGASISTAVNNSSFAVNLVDQSIQSLGSTITLSGNASARTSTQYSYGLFIQQQQSSTGAVTLQLSESSLVNTTGDNAYGVFGQQSGAGSTGGIILNISGDARVVTSGSVAYGVLLQQNAAGATGSVGALMSEQASIETSGVGSEGLLLRKEANDATGNVIAELKGLSNIKTTGDNSDALLAEIWSPVAPGDISLSLLDSSSVSTSGSESRGLYAGQFGFGDAAIQLGGSATAATSGARSKSAYALSGLVGNTAVQIDGEQVMRQVFDGQGQPRLNADGTAQLLAVSAPAVNMGSGNTTILMSGGAVTNSGDASQGLVAENNSVGGSAMVTMSGGTLTSGGTGSKGISAIVAAPKTVQVDPETGLAVFTFQYNADGSIRVDGSGNAVMLPVYVVGPERFLDANGVVVPQTGNALAEIGTETETALVSITGENTVGVQVCNEGTGTATARVLKGGRVTADGAGTKAISACADPAVTNTGAVTVDIQGEVTASGAGSIAVDVASNSATASAMSVAADSNVTNLSTDGVAFKAVGTASGNLVNAGEVIGGIDINGSFTNAASAQASLVGAQRMAIAGGLDNSGLIDLSATSALTAMTVQGNLANNGRIILGTNDAAVAGNLTGAGTIQSAVDFASGTSGTLTVDGNLDGAVVVDLRNVGGQVTAAGIRAVNILDVKGTATGSVMLANGPIDLGVYVYDIGIVGGKVENIITVSAPASTYSAVPAVISQGYATTRNFNQRVAARTYSQPASNTEPLGFWAVQPRSESAERFDSVIARKQERDLKSGMWGSIAADRSKRTPDTGNTESLTSWTLDGGYDYVLDGNGSGDVIIGGGFSLGMVSASMQSALGTTSASSTGGGVFFTGTYLAETGTYVDAQFDVGHIYTDLHDNLGVLLAEDVTSLAMVGSIELGHKFAIDEQSSFTPHVRYVLGQVKTDGYVDSRGLSVADQTDRLSELRIGGEYEHVLDGGLTLAVFGEYRRDLDPASTVDVSGVSLTSTGERDWGNLGMRFDMPITSMASFNGQVAYQAALGGANGNNSVTARVGLDVRW